MSLMILSIVGSVASIVGAIIAIHQASNATNSAEAAQSTADSLRRSLAALDHSRELGDLQTACKRGIDAVKKYTYQPERGGNRDEDLATVIGVAKDFHILLGEHQSLFDQSFKEDVSKHSKRLTRSFEKVQAGEADGPRGIDNDILHTMVDLSRIIKDSLDDQKQLVFARPSS